jgi:hypothetical protein
MKEAGDFSYRDRRIDWMARYFHAMRVDHGPGLFWQHVRPSVDSTDKHNPGRNIPEHWWDAAELGRDYLRALIHSGIRPIVENLGTWYDWQQKVLDEEGVPGFGLPRYLKKDNGQFRGPSDLPRSMMLSTSTHDTSQLRDYWMTGRAKDSLDEGGRAALAAAYGLQLGLGQLPSDFTPEVHRALLHGFARTPPVYFMVPDQDVRGSSEKTHEVGKGHLAGGTPWGYCPIIVPEERANDARLLAEVTVESGRAR